MGDNNVSEVVLVPAQIGENFYTKTFAEKYWAKIQITI